jgi:hypothetical protein
MAIFLVSIICMTGHQEFLPIVLFSTQNESAIYAMSDSLSDDENEEDIIAMLHVLQALHEHMSTLGWAGFVLGCDYVHCDREAAHRCCIVIIFHKIQPTVKFSSDVGLQSVHIFLSLVFELVFTCNFPYWCLFAQVLNVLFFTFPYSACCRGASLFCAKKERNEHLALSCLQ